MRCKSCIIFAESAACNSVIISSSNSVGAIPSADWTIARSISSPWLLIWSSKLILSRKLPPPCCAINSKPAWSIENPSSDAICARWAVTSGFSTGLNVKRWVRLTIVSGSLWASVVARINTTCAGGSSSVFSSALKASLVSMCTSSIMYTLYFAEVGAICTRSRNSLISSILRLLAASISMISRWLLSSW